jgi:hypothetical protein
MVRLVLALVTGYVLVVVSSALLFQLTGQDTHAAPSVTFGLVSIVWMAWSAALAGYVATRITQQDSMVPSLLMGCLLAIGLLSALLNQGAQWSRICALVLMAPAAVAGGLLNRRKQR